MLCNALMVSAEAVAYGKGSCKKGLCVWVDGELRATSPVLATSVRKICTWASCCSWSSESSMNGAHINVRKMPENANLDRSIFRLCGKAVDQRRWRT